MAETVTWDGLRELAGFQAEKGCAISLYLDLDPSITPTAGDADARVSSLLAEGERRAEAESRSMTHEQRVALKNDFARIRDFFENDFDRDGARGLAVFTARLDNVWRPRRSSSRFRTESGSGRSSTWRRSCRSSVEAKARSSRSWGASAASSTASRGPARRDRRPQRRGSRASTTRAAGRSRATSDTSRSSWASTCGRSPRSSTGACGSMRSPKVIIVSSEETRAELDDLLSKEVQTAVIGWTSAEAHAGPPELLELTSPFLEEARAREEAEIVERWREEAGRGGRAASGWEETLEAASDARIDVLLYEGSARARGLAVPALRTRCRPRGGQCPLDGTETEHREDGLDPPLHQTIANGGTVWAVSNRRDLDPVEGIGALLRF